MAEPPHIEEPTPISVDILPDILIILWRIKAIINDVDMVHKIMGNDCLPVWSITFRLRPKPKKTTEVCKIYFEVNFITFYSSILSFKKMAIIMPVMIAIIGPPITGNFLPRVHEGRAIIKHINRPSQFSDINFLNKFIYDQSFQDILTVRL